MISYSNKLYVIRSALKHKSLDAYIIPLSGPYPGTEVPGHWNIIRWLTGFSGSAAIVIITESFAGLWTDPRYWIQAEKELEGSGFELIRPAIFRTGDVSDWLDQNMTRKSKIAFDGRIFSFQLLKKLQEKLIYKEIIFDGTIDLISESWINRPEAPFSMAWEHTLEFSGKDRSRKIAELRHIMKKRNVDIHLLSSPDDIMWLLNIRGNDLLYSPLILAYALIDMTRVALFADPVKIPDLLAEKLIQSGVLIRKPEVLIESLSSYKDSSSLLITPSTTSVAVYNSIPSYLRVIPDDVSIPSAMKSKKNKVEIRNIEETMIRDGVAITRFFFYIEKNIGTIYLSEISAAGKLLEFRSKQRDFLGPSFATISAFNEHAALPHYTPAHETDSELRKNGIYLVDSGGQYMGGTTDLTRTISLGSPAYRQKKDFTLVLKGHIRIARAKFPVGTKGYQLDILAREALWNEGLDYGHGTGHGVGYCLNVHEGPQSISPSFNKTALESGMLISNEPAIYREGKYGIRTENLMLCYEDEESDFGEFLKFDTVSLCYIDKTLIDKSLLDNQEIEWLNNYHNEVYDKLSPYLADDEKIWLREKTEPV